MVEIGQSHSLVWTSRRAHLRALVEVNGDYLQWHIERALDTVPRLLRAPLLHVLKAQTGVTQDRLWVILLMILDNMSDEQADGLIDGAQGFLGEL